MDFLMATAPNGLWAWLINSIEGKGILYGATIILVTLIIKFVLIPADVFNKYSSKKNMDMQAKLKPELDTLKRRYANNPQLLNEKTQQLYKRENFSMGGTCAGMLIYMILTMVIFFTLLSTLNGMSAYKLQQEYNTLYQTYRLEISTSSDPSNPTEEEIANAQAKVTQKYEEIREGFIWIKNIWRPDTSASVTPSYDNFASTAKISEKQRKGSEYSKLSEEELAEIESMSESELADYNMYTKQTYDLVMGDLLTNSKYTKWNGYFILPVLAALLNLGSMQLMNFISAIKAKKKGLPKPASTNKMLSLILPLIMGIFTLLYNAAFGLYIVAGALFSFITTPLVSIIVDKIVERQAKNKKSNKASYDRTNK